MFFKMQATVQFFVSVDELMNIREIKDFHTMPEDSMLQLLYLPDLALMNFHLQNIQCTFIKSSLIDRDNPLKHKLFSGSASKVSQIQSTFQAKCHVQTHIRYD